MYKSLLAILALLGSVAALSPQSYDQKIESAMKRIDAVIARGPFKASWESLETHQTPGWYADAKFGIFIHWGLYAVPAFGKSGTADMYLADSDVFKHHLAQYGPQSKFGYKDFIPKFRAEKYRPEEWQRSSRRLEPGM
jgi:alpha-L-fucosidase